MTAKWIPCAERMPDPQVSVLIACTETDDGEGTWVGAGFWLPEGWQSQDSFQLDKPIPWAVSHWMEMPEAPVVECERVGDK